MPITLRLSMFLIFLINVAAHADPAEDFRALLDEAWEWHLVQSPVLASSLGDRRFNDQWGDSSIEARRREQPMDQWGQS